MEFQLKPGDEYSSRGIIGLQPNLRRESDCNKFLNAVGQYCSGRFAAQSEELLFSLRIPTNLLRIWP